jgi:serine phosphatase RsbU (regulator of sigma subunit)
MAASLPEHPREAAMDARPTTSALLAWLLVPVAAYLVQSALSLPERAYTGLALRGDLVATVEPGSPGERAGLRPGDRLRAPGRSQPGLASDPLAGTVAGRPMTLLRYRGAEARPVWLAPDPLPPGERRLSAMLLIVASLFVMVGGWVWSERRDALTRAFFLVCITFGVLLAPPPRGISPAGSMLLNLAITGLAILLPALFVQFFATFPEARALGRRQRWIRAAYWVAAAVAALSLAAVVAQAVSAPVARWAGDVAQMAAAVWFALGTLLALLLFAASFAAAGSADARRRLRVAFVGSLVGLGPFTALTVFRSLWPGVAIPGDRSAVALILLVPASFAWAIVVHRVFDFRIALRAAVTVVIVAAACGTAWALGEWSSSQWSAPLGADLAGGALALVALAASLAGPAAPVLQVLGARIVPGDEIASLTPWLHERTSSAAATGQDSLLTESCAVVARFLRLDGCAALTSEHGTVYVVRGPASGGVAAPSAELRARAFRLAASGLLAVDEAGLGHQDRRAMRSAGVSWLLPVGEVPVRAVLLLGRRLAGPWLSRRETLELERFARGLAVALENAELRREATSHGALERELVEAGRMQANLLPQRVPVSPTLDCAAAVLSSEPVGGDYFDFVEGPDRSFTLAVGDVAGHGLPAALLLSHVQARFRTHAHEDLTPGELLGVLNQDIAEFDQPQKFVGLVCARVDVRRGRIWIANAGLTPPLLRRQDGRIEEVEASGTLLGVQRGTRYADRCLDLARGDMIMVHTDGLTEAQRGDELFGMDRARELLRNQGDRRAVDVLDTMVREARAFADRPLDDLTLVVLRQLASPPANHGPGIRR